MYSTDNFEEKNFCKVSFLEHLVTSKYEKQCGAWCIDALFDKIFFLEKVASVEAEEQDGSHEKNKNWSTSLNFSFKH